MTTIFEDIAAYMVKQQERDDARRAQTAADNELIRMQSEMKKKLEALSKDDVEWRIIRDLIRQVNK